MEDQLFLVKNLFINESKIKSMKLKTIITMSIFCGAFILQSCHTNIEIQKHDYPITPLDFTHV